MHTRHRRFSARAFRKAGLSCLLAAGAAMPLAAHADMVPELLALADWPLDPPAGATGEEPALPMAEIAGHPDVVRVVAWETADGPPALLPEPPEAVVLAEEEMGDAELVPVSPAAEPEPDPDSPGLQVAALDSSTLDEIRGGFEIGDGNLKLSFGIERAVYINGNLVASTVLTVRDLQGMAGAGLPAELANSALTVIQNGAGNGFSAQINPNLAGTVIQNTLNDQNIVNITTINATVNSAQVLRSMALQQAIRDGVVGGLRR